MCDGSIIVRCKRVTAGPLSNVQIRPHPVGCWMPVKWKHPVGVFVKALNPWPSGSIKFQRNRKMAVMLLALLYRAGRSRVWRDSPSRRASQTSSVFHCDGVKPQYVIGCQSVKSYFIPKTDPHEPGTLPFGGELLHGPVQDLVIRARDEEIICWAFHRNRGLPNGLQRSLLLGNFKDWQQKVPSQKNACMSHPAMAHGQTGKVEKANSINCQQLLTPSMSGQKYLVAERRWHWQRLSVTTCQITKCFPQEVIDST